MVGKLDWLFYFPSFEKFDLEAKVSLTDFEMISLFFSW
jgi:hypothetical protein